MDLVIDPETIGIDFKIVDSSVRAILIKKHSAGRAIRVFSNPIRNVVIGLNKGTSFVIVIIGSVKECILLGNPLVRYFRRRSS